MMMMWMHSLTKFMGVIFRLTKIIQVKLGTSSAIYCSQIQQEEWALSKQNNTESSKKISKFWIELTLNANALHQNSERKWSDNISMSIYCLWFKISIFDKVASSTAVFYSKMLAYSKGIRAREWMWIYEEFAMILCFIWILLLHN